jgi:hydroxypyruvate isomerase
MDRRRFGKFAAAAGVGGLLPLGGPLPSALPHAAWAQLAPLAPPAEWRFSVMLWTLNKLGSFDRCLEMVAEAGYQGVELIGEFHKWDGAETERVMAKMRSLHLRFDMLSGMKSGFADPAGGDGLMAELAAQFKTAKALGSSQVNLKSGPRIPGLSPEAQHAASVENLKRAAAAAAAANIQIVIEPIDAIENPTMFMTSVSEGFAIAREVKSPHLRVLYDFFHEQRGAGNLIEKLEKNIDLVGLVHIADSPARNQPGTGEIDYENIYRKLAELRYDGFITMEFFPLGDPVAALKKARREAQSAAQHEALRNAG